MHSRCSSPAWRLPLRNIWECQVRVQIQTVITFTPTSIRMGGALPDQSKQHTARQLRHPRESESLHRGGGYSRGAALGSRTSFWDAGLLITPHPHVLRASGRLGSCASECSHAAKPRSSSCYRLEPRQHRRSPRAAPGAAPAIAARWASVSDGRSWATCAGARRLLAAPQSSQIPPQTTQPSMARGLMI